MNIERIQNLLSAYAMQRPERVIADSKHTETANAVSLDGEKRENRERKESALRPEQEATNSGSEAKDIDSIHPAPPKTPGVLDIRA